MLNIFYQKNTLDDTLIINVSNAKPTKISTNGDITIGYVNDEFAFANIKNASKKLNDLENGLIFPCLEEVVLPLNKLLNVDLMKYFDNGFKVAEIIKCENIEGTHLHKCEVNVGDKVLHIVCGAPNARSGLKTVCATAGTMLPDGKQIIPGALLGHKSEGMLCSFRELGLPQETERGIIELDDKHKVGEYYHNAYSNCRE